MNNNKPNQNSKLKDDERNKIIRFLKKTMKYLSIIIISSICGALLEVSCPNIRLLIKNMSNLIILVISLITFIYLTFKLSGLSIKTLTIFCKKYKKTARLFFSFNLVVLLIIPFIFSLVSVLFEPNSGISLSDYFNYFSAILTAEFAFFGIQYQLFVSRKDEKERVIRQQVLNGMNKITGNYKSINDSLENARNEWDKNTLAHDYSDLNFEKMSSFLEDILNYNFTCQQENEIFQTCDFKYISANIRKLDQQVSNTLIMEKIIIGVLSEKKGEIDSLSKERVGKMNDYLKNTQGSIERLNKEIQNEVLDLTVGNKKIKTRFERV